MFIRLYLTIIVAIAIIATALGILAAVWWMY